MEVEPKRTRGPNKQEPWARRPQDGVSVLRLALDVHDPQQRRRLERMFADAYRVRRALQRAARNRTRAYWAAKHERGRDAAGTRDRLGLSRGALEHTAYAVLDAAPHLRRFVTKALAMHLADSVWSAAERHLFPDATGKRQGLLHVGRWFDFGRLPGRARSHTTARKWETFRLHGSLAGHRLGAPSAPGGRVDWWAYQGPLMLVFSGLADGSLVLPVRLPTAPCNQPILDYHLADPSLWHKVDLVRTRAPHAPGGWRYEAHLMVLKEPYVSPATRVRRAEVAVAEADRLAGIDVNVSNLTIASQVAGGDLRLTRIARDLATKDGDRGRRRRERRRQRALDRSRRAANSEQYRLSKRQEKRARRRAAAGLTPVNVIPQGPRIARSDGVPLQAYRRDQLSRRHRRLRAEEVASAAAGVQARRDRARRVAAQVVQTHGYRIFAEEGHISAWARRWGRGVAAFTPGLLVSASTARQRRWHASPRPREASSGSPPARPRSPSIAPAAPACRRPSPTGSTAARTAASGATATPSPRCSRASSCSTSPANPTRRASTTPPQTAPAPKSSASSLLTCLSGGKTPGPSQTTSSPARPVAPRGGRPHRPHRRWLGEPPARPRAQPGMSLPHGRPRPSGPGGEPVCPTTR
ncbi:MAG: hypothetical protein QM704_14290 [Anaeromyxobacteraceae bacterium]